MSKSADRLRWRREALLRRVEVQRQELHGHVARIGGTLDRADRGLEMVRRVASPPVLVAAAVGLTLLLGQGRAHRLLAAGLPVLGLVLRARSAGQLLAGLAGRRAAGRAGGQDVSRSR